MACTLGTQLSPPPGKLRGPDFLHNTLNPIVNSQHCFRRGSGGSWHFWMGLGSQMDAIRVELQTDLHRGGTADLVLIEREGSRVVHMCIGLFEAAAIRRRLANEPVSRPQTHDLLDNTIAALDARPHHVLIRHEDNGVFFADLVLERHGKHVVIDARPSDALALCCKLDLPIYADAEMLERLEIERRLLAAPIT